MRNTIATILFAAGLFLAICTMDGSNHELLLRGAGMLLAALGAHIGRWFDKTGGSTDSIQ